ncbi:unnamed protein product [Didymodactylos carnosus]|uniref:HAD family hydrolase n=1 Tax=Didymodactylos carnosus TaxID=1234261 RepID=A0A815X5B0_9BILA|nr:unnamed protein product [Didymodactylos carnosus]CAF1551463.1 unnamed protein product [Didymodactylos carnosus]CAF3526388.1 unnamed protein product [Didymodactylos carnosus]CAF4412462.1 unnamed protein product [Didymodactylos carnosus]
MSKMTKPIIALDCDGVLLNYNKTYGLIYSQTFGQELIVVNPRSYHAKNMYNITMTDEEKIEFNRVFDGWRNMPMFDGALEACNLLRAAGYELFCVTAIPEKFVQARLENLQKHGFSIDRVIGNPTFDMRNTADKLRGG